MNDTRHIADVIIEDYLLPNGLVQKDIWKMMNIKQSSFNSVMTRRSEPTLHFYVMMAKITGTDVNYWIDQNARWLKAQAAIISPNIRDRIIFHENKEHVPMEPIPFTTEEASYFGHGMNVPHRTIKRYNKAKNQEELTLPKPFNVNDVFNGKTKSM